MKTLFARPAGLVGAVLALAMIPGSAASAQDMPVATTVSAQEPEATGLFEVRALDESALSNVSGREGLPTWQTATSSSNATVQGNSNGDGSPTGALGVSGSAFQNLSGISMVNLNTGNASSINATMNVNLTIAMAPAPTGGM